MKTKITSIMLAVGVLAGMSIPASSQTVAPGSQWNDEYREYYDVPVAGGYTGRSPYMRTTGTPVQPPPPVVVAAAPAPRPVVLPTPPPAPLAVGCSSVRTGPVHATMNMPPQVAYGEEFMYEIALNATECVGNVVVKDQIPAGATYVRSEPPAQVAGNQLTWTFPSMDAGQNQSIKVWAKADKEGELTTCATVTADPRLCAKTVVGKPALAITKTGPATAQLGSEVRYDIVVSNPGSMVAKNVVVTDVIPDGLTQVEGKRQLDFQVGDLGPGQSRSIPVVLKAAKRGRVCNPAVAKSSNAGTVNAEACTTILQPGIKVAKTGDAEQFTGRIANYTITVSNTGDTELSNVVVTDTAPAETSIIAAEGGSVAGNTASWTIPTLKQGESKNMKLQLTSRVVGNLCNKVSASAAGMSDSAQACTLWKGQPAMLNEVVDDPDPIGVGVTTTYTIRITNQGTAPDTNYKVVATFEDEIDPVSASNGGTVAGKTVTWPVYPRMEAKQSFQYTVVGKAVKLGDHRLKITVVSDGIPRQVIEEESTQVY